MNNPLPTAPLARAIERNLFGGMIGMLASTVIARLLLLAMEIPVFILGFLLLIGAATGAFVTHYGSRSAETVTAAFGSWNTRLRRVSLMVMLWMLALATVIGILTVLTASYDTLGRVAGTVITTAFAAGLLWPLSLLADRKETQPSGLLGMASVIIVYLLVIPLIWDLDRQHEEMLVSSLVIGFTVPFGMFFLGLLNNPNTWIAARAGVGFYVTVLVIFLIATWHPGNWRASQNWWTTGLWCSTYGALSFMCLCGMRRIVSVDWRWLGVAAAFVAWLIALFSVWGGTRPPENWLISISGFSIVIAHASLSVLVPLKGHQIWLRWGTVAAVAMASAFVDLEIIYAPGNGLSMLGRVAGAATIAASCGSLALIIFARLNRATRTDSPNGIVAEITEITLNCPQCNKRLTGSIGVLQCGGCGLCITTSIQQPDEPEEGAASPFADRD